MKTVEDILYGKPMKSMSHMLSDLELALVTVRDIVDRLSNDGDCPADYITVNLGLYALHVQAVLVALRQFNKAEQDGPQAA